jgi:hypothetical protein
LIVIAYCVIRTRFDSYVRIPVARTRGAARTKQGRVTGTDHNGTIAVDKRERSENGDWQEVNLKGKE